MTAKKKPAPEAPKNKRELHVKQYKDEDPDKAISRVLISPEFTAASCMQAWEDINRFSGLMAALDDQVKLVHDGNLKRPEAMLLSQAHTLDLLFNKLAQKAHCQSHMPHYESFLRLAFKAQGQCRATLETLSAIKNPPVIFAKQANISNGHQQINNGVPAPHTEENKNHSNELLTELPNATLDTGRTSEAICVNSDLEAVG
jgi:hypothetical protein